MFSASCFEFIPYSPDKIYLNTFYLREFKTGSCETGLRTWEQLAGTDRKDLDIGQGLISRWKGTGLRGQSAFPGKGNLKPEDRESAAPGQEVIRLRRERDILKSSGHLLGGSGQIFGFMFTRHILLALASLSAISKFISRIYDISFRKCIARILAIAHRNMPL